MSQARCYNRAQMELSPLWTGIIAGIIVCAIVAGGRELALRVIMPWFENKVYRDVRLDRYWEAVYYIDDKKEVRETAEVRQKANKVTGVIRLEGATAIRDYEFRGQIRSLLLTAEYWLKGQSNGDRGTFALTVKENARKLEGYLSWYSDIHDEIRFSTYVWKKR